jgi:hypothetical protein
MKRIITNPEWVNAKYQEGLVWPSGKTPDWFDNNRLPRFNSLPDGDDREDASKYFNWIKSHAIPRFIEVDEP